MNFIDTLGQTASVAVAVERTVEILKPVYLAFKVRLFKKEQAECSKLEKDVITILLSILICITMGIGIDIPGITETNTLQEILAGLVSSFGSTILHMLLSILTGIKDTVETRAVRMRNGNGGRSV